MLFLETIIYFLYSWYHFTPLMLSEISKKSWRAKLNSLLPHHLWYKSMSKIVWQKCLRLWPLIFLAYFWLSRWCELWTIEFLVWHEKVTNLCLDVYLFQFCSTQWSKILRESNNNGFMVLKAIACYIIKAGLDLNLIIVRTENYTFDL